jgi:hypothetical protein
MTKRVETDMEADEIQEFSKQMQESGEGGESLTKISLAISILAVLVAMVTVLGHRSHTDAVLSQAKASDMWNEYQAKRIRSSQLSGIQDMLELQPSSDAGAVAAKLKTYGAQQEKWKDETKDEREKALDFEKDVQHAERQATRYDIGEALLQISVVLCSVTLFTRKRLYFLAGLTVGLVGLVAAASGLLVGK